MALSTLAQIKKKVRRLTASPDPTQLSDADIEEYVDTFYEQDLPAHLKLWKLRQKYTFWTEPNVAEYTIDDDTYGVILQPMYCDGNEIYYTQSQAEFFRLYPKQNTEQNLGAGNGGAVYAFTLTDTPILPKQVSITAVDGSGSQLVAEDNGSGSLLDSVSKAVIGTIDYTTGVVAVTFTSVIPATSTIYARYVPYTAARPRAAMYYENVFHMRPVPDKAYRVEMDVYRTPTQALDADGDEPELKQWWQFIALGAAKKVLEDRMDLDSLQNMLPVFEEQKQLVLQRTVKQQTAQRTATIYTQQTQAYPGNLSNW